MVSDAPWLQNWIGGPMQIPQVLILGASHAEMPIVVHAKERGCHVTIIGLSLYKPNLKFCDNFFRIDYSSYKKVAKIIEEYSITHLIPGCNDFALLNATRLANAYNLAPHLFDTFAVATSIHHKHLFRETIQKIGLNAPPHLVVTEVGFSHELIADGTPVLVKPVDLSGGIGITLIKNKKYLRQAVEYAFDVTREKKIIIEHFWEGTEHSGQFFIRDQAITFSSFADEYSSENTPFKIQGAKVSRLLTDEDRTEIFKQVEKIAQYLKLVDGFIQLQFIRTNSHGLFIIEMTRRLPGDRLPDAFLYSFGYDMYQHFLTFMLNRLIPNIVPKNTPQKLVYRHVLEGAVSSDIKNHLENPNIKILDFIDLRSKSARSKKPYDTRKVKIGIILFEVKNNVELQPELIDKIFFLDSN